MNKVPDFAGDANRSRADAQPISRRTWLGSTAVIVCAAAVLAEPLRAKAQQKMKQADAKYQTTPKGSAKCAACTQFQAPNACKLVEGDINPEGWCQLYTPRAHG